MPGKYRICLDTDAWSFGGAGRVGHDEDHFTSPGGPNTFVGPYEQEPRPCALKVLSPSRSAQVFYKVPEDEIDMSLNVGAGENVHNLRQPGGLRVEPIGSVPPPRSNAPPPPPPPPPPAANAVAMQVVRRGGSRSIRPRKRPTRHGEVGAAARRADVLQPPRRDARRSRDVRG